MKLPTDVSGQELVKVLQRVGFAVNRQKGSHIILRRADPFARVVVPDRRTTLGSTVIREQAQSLI